MIVSITIAILILLLIYSFLIEPYLIKVKHYNLNNKTNNELKIVQISDIHLKKHFNLKHLSKIINKINNQNPDIVIFTGDLYDKYDKYHDDTNLVNLLKQIKAKTKLAVSGNHDYLNGSSKIFSNIMENSDFILLDNKEEILKYSTKTISFTGIPDFEYNKNVKLDKATSDYNVLITHEPEAIDKIDEKYNLILAGHSHGAQFIISFLTILITKVIKNCHHSFKYIKGFYETKAGKLYVNPGIGTTRIPARFGVVPSITVFHLYF